MGMILLAAQTKRGEALEFGNRIAACRAALGWSQQELAQFSGLSQSRISRIETGSTARMDELEILARTFSVTESQLLDERLSPEKIARKKRKDDAKR